LKIKKEIDGNKSQKRKKKGEKRQRGSAVGGKSVPQKRKNVRGGTSHVASVKGGEKKTQEEVSFRVEGDSLRRGEWGGGWRT